MSTSKATTPTSAEPRHDPKEMRKVIVGSVARTAMEAYDLYIYGTAAALIFGQLFFPSDNPVASTMAALASFAVSFVARPLGAIVFGHYGDRIGRKKMLFITLLCMGVSTFLIGLLPTYSVLGIAAPAMLILLRFLQGFGYGGEYSGAVLMLLEHAPAEKRGFYAGLNNIGPAIGFIASSLAFVGAGLLMSEEAFLSWGWRIPFLLSAVLVILGLFVRSRVAESPLFLEAQAQAEARKKEQKLPLGQLFRKHTKEVLIVVGANVSQFVTFYILVTFVLSYATSELNLDRDFVLMGVIIAVATNFVTIPVASRLSDRIGRRKTIIIGSVGLIAWAFPMFALLNTANFGLMLIGFIGLMIPYCFVYGPLAAFSTEIFSTSVRFTGAAVSYNLAGIVAGAFAPLIASALFLEFDSWIPLSLYLAVASLVTLISVAVARNRTAMDVEHESLAATRVARGAEHATP